jgi:PAS domain S-box-containing protein
MEGCDDMKPVEIDEYSLFDHVYKFVPIGIAFVSLEGTWLKVNPALCNTLGYSKEELLQLTFQDLTHPDDLDLNNSIANRLIIGEASSYELEKRYIRKNGNVKWASLHVSLVRDELDETPLYFITHIIDISEKKAAEQKLLETERLYQLISENAQDIISYGTPDGIIHYCSPSVFDLLGYKPGEIIGNTKLMELYHPDDLRGLQAMLFADNDVFSTRIRHKNGNYIWFETNFKVIRDEQGEVLNIVGIGRDITERKKNEDNLAEAQRIAMLGSWEWDILNGKIVFSDQMYRIYDIDPKQKLSKPKEALHLVHSSDQRHVMEAIKKAFHHGACNLEFRHLQQDGTVQFLNIRGVVHYNVNGKPSKMNGTVQDITERKNVELKLQESIQRYTSLKNYNHDAVISLDLEGNIINTNTMAEKLSGYTVHEMAGTSISRIIGAEHLQRILTKPQEHISTEKNINTVYHRDGHTVEVLTTIAPIVINSEITGYYVIAKDITEQKKLLIAKETAEKTNKAKSEFLAMMSHEIRTPMNGVIGMTDLLIESAELNPEQREYVEIIRKSGSSLLGIINGILDFSKIESGKTELQEGPLDIRQCIAETFDILSSKAHEKQLELSFTVCPDIPEQLRGDSDRLKQVLLNLTGNSIKFTHMGGVTITVNMLSQKGSGVKIEFIVKDTGIGVPKEQIHQLFEPFYQLDHYMTRQYEGTGLGLAICRRLVTLMDGEIWVEPVDDEGLKVVFTAIFKHEDYQQCLEQRELGEADQTAPKKLKILVAEDNEINQLVIKKILEKQGHTVSIAENGNEVIQMAAFEAFDIIFMDVHMPDMNGLEATEILKSKMASEKCPIIIAVTANALNGDREKCLEAGMDEYLSKPIKNEAVSEMIRKFFPTLAQ